MPCARLAARYRRGFSAHLRTHYNKINRVAAEKGRMQALRITRELVPIDRAHLVHTNYAWLHLAARHGKSEAAKWLCEAYDIPEEALRRDACCIIRSACDGRAVPFLSYLRRRFCLTRDDIRAGRIAMMHEAAALGYYLLLVELCQGFGMTLADIRVNDCYVLRVSAAGGHFRAVQFLCTHYNLGYADVSACGDAALNSARALYHFKMVEFLEQRRCIGRTGDNSEEPDNECTTSECASESSPTPSCCVA